MPKFIKDGAYTIKVEDSQPKTQILSGLSARFNIEDSSNSENKPASPFELSLNLGVNTIKEGLDEDKTIADSEYTKGSQRSEKSENEENTNDKIDFTSPQFILRNLSLALPKKQDDKTNILRSREDLGECICSQICFYCYLALHVFADRITPISILIFGDGFYGSRIIQTLIEFGCGSMLKVFTRSDYKAKEWNLIGVKSDDNLIKLLSNGNPDIIICNTDNSSFTSICNRMLDSQFLTHKTFFITTTLGFQRKKLFNNLNIPTIFRTYLEPMDHLKSYKLKAMNKLSNLMGNNNFKKNTDSLGLMDKLSSTHQSAAENIVTRSLDILNLVFILENFYAMFRMSPSKARKLALKVVLGYNQPNNDEASIDENINDNQSTDNSEMSKLKKKYKAIAIQKENLEIAKNKLFDNVVCHYHKEFSKSVTLSDLQTLLSEFSDNKTPLKRPSSSSKRKTSKAIGLNEKPKYLENPDKLNYPMHNKQFFIDIFSNDEVYKQYQGPGFDFMRKADQLEIEVAGEEEINEDVEVNGGVDICVAERGAGKNTLELLLANEGKQEEGVIESEEDHKKEKPKLGRSYSTVQKKIQAIRRASVSIQKEKFSGNDANDFLKNAISKRL